MADWDEPRKPTIKATVLGEDLATLSEDELAERIDQLKAEIVRVEAALTSKQASRAAAAGFFKS